MNPLIQGHSGTAPETSRNAFTTNQLTNEDDSQSDLLPEGSIFHGQMAQYSGPVYDHDMVTGATEQIGNCHDMSGVHEEVTYCPLVHLQASRRKTALPVTRNSAVRTPLRQLRQTKICSPFSSWQITTILRIFTIISTECPNC